MQESTNFPMRMLKLTRYLPYLLAPIKSKLSLNYHDRHLQKLYEKSQKNGLEKYQV